MNEEQQRTARAAMEEAIAEAGSQNKLAKIIGIKQQAVSHFVAKGRIPLEHVMAIERATGVSRHRLRPDLSDIFRECPDL